MNRLLITDLALPGLKCVERRPLGDARGFLARLFCADELAQVGWSKPIAQINQTYTAKCGTVRGMHFQRPPYSEMKLVTCLQGRVWDVAVDLRAGSETFLHWCAQELSASNHKAMLIPEGFAHGFQTLSDDVELLYCHSTAYNSQAEAGLNPYDSALSIDWPLEVVELSERDARHPMITRDFAGLVL